jgi:hypothetical protein
MTRLTPALAAMGFTTYQPDGKATDYDGLNDPAGQSVGFLRDRYMGITRKSLRSALLTLPNARPTQAQGVGFPLDGYSEVKAAQEVVKSIR